MDLWRRSHDQLAYLIDPLTCIMLLVITGGLPHPRLLRWLHACMGRPVSRTFLRIHEPVHGLDVLLVMGNNYVVLFIGWEWDSARTY